MLYYGIDRGPITMEAPPLTKHISRTLERYPDGGQILKVSDNTAKFGVILCSQTRYREWGLAA